MTFSISIASSEEERESVLQQRYRAYAIEGAIGENNDEKFHDVYDRQSTTMLIMCHFDGRLVGTLRFSVEPPNAEKLGVPASCPELAVFKDELTSIASEGFPIASGSRFAIDCNFLGRRKASLLLLLAQVRAANAVCARWGIATARGSHLLFYRRFLLMEPISDERLMPGLNFNYRLLASNLNSNYETSLRRLGDELNTEFDQTSPNWEASVRDHARKIKGAHEWLPFP